MQKKPKNTSVATSITRQPFYTFETTDKGKEEFEYTRLLPIPMAIDEYNRFISGVDIADQLRAGFLTQQQGVKQWCPLVCWLLDSSITNAFRLSENRRKSRLAVDNPNKVQSAH